MFAMKTSNEPKTDKKKLIRKDWQKSLWLALSGLLFFVVSFRFAFADALSPESFHLSPLLTFAVLGLITGWALLMKGFLIAIQGANRDKPRCSGMSIMLALPLLITFISMITVLPVMFL